MLIPNLHSLSQRCVTGLVNGTKESRVFIHLSFYEILLDSYTKHRSIERCFGEYIDFLYKICYPKQGKFEISMEGIVPLISKILLGVAFLLLAFAAGTGDRYVEMVAEYGVAVAGPDPWDKEVALMIGAVGCTIAALLLCWVRAHYRRRHTTLRMQPSPRRTSQHRPF